MTARPIACPECQQRLVLSRSHREGRRVRCPRCGKRFVPFGDLPPPNPTHRPRDAPPPEGTERSRGRPHADIQSEEVRIALDSLAAPLPSSSRARRRRNPLAAWTAGGIVLCGLVVSGLMLLNRRHPAATVPLTPPDHPTAAIVPPPPIEPQTRELQPPDGEPLRLYMTPSGVRMLVHFRPARLWSDDPAMSELRGCLTQDVVAALEEVIRRLVNRDPAVVEELLLTWILGARGSAPQRAAVVRFAAEEPLSDLIEEFGGEPLDEFSPHKIYLHADRAVLIRDQRTLAFAPREFAAELAEWIDAPNDNASDGVLALLEHTDRRRLLTAVFEPAEVLRQADVLATKALCPGLQAVASWFEVQAETVAWSIDAGDEFSSVIVLRGRSTDSSSAIAARMTERLESLPHELVELARALNPQRAGFRRIVGRLPAMVEVARRGTRTAVGERLVRFSTVLPAKAAPNLALAVVLTWDRSLRAAASAGPPHPANDAPAVETLSEKLRRPIEIEFRRTPLEEALEFIGHEIGVEIELDGDALKDAGYTRNMPQTMTLGRVPAGRALRAILDQYQQPGKEMVLVLDEARHTITVRTLKFAAQSGQTPYEPGR